jgi:transcriptional regulator NrdR family protein
MSHEGGHFDIIKRAGRRPSESFNRQKLHDSIVAACLSAGTPTGHAEQIARNVVDAVIAWLQSRPEVTSEDIRRIAAKHLRTFHPDAAYLYEHHRSIV